MEKLESVVAKYRDMAGEAGRALKAEFPRIGFCEKAPN